MDYLVNNTRARIVFIFISTAASNRLVNDDNQHYPMYDSNSSNRTNYINAKNQIKILVERYGCNVIDCDANGWAFEQRRWGSLMADWIHPSYLGGWLLGRYIWRQLQEIYPNPDFPEDTVNQTKSTYTYSNDTN